MKRISFVIGLVLLMNLGALCHPISPTKAQHLAETFWQQSGCAARSGLSANTLVDITAQTGFSHLYIFSNVSGFVILSGDDCTKPILAYSTNSGFDPEHIPTSVRDWLYTYEIRIEDAANQHLEATPEIAAQWELLLSGQWRDSEDAQIVAPIITARWGQGSPYNALCPPNTPVGCVAVAMGQVMHHWRYPEHGIGSHSYTYNGITHNVDFSNATYNWDAMPNSCGSANNAVATLLYHCGVAIETWYTSSNSTAYVLYSPALPYNAETALKGIPIIYNGFNSSNAGGHCFICDGYDANDFFHFNWGQRGNYDGYFEIDDMTPSNQNFSYNQGAILDLVPATDEIKENTTLEPFVYPNPTTGVFTIECKSTNLDGCCFRIYDIFGKLLISNNLTKENNAIDLSNQPAGIYFLQLIEDGESAGFQKIVKMQ